MLRSRPVQDADKEILERWIDADEDHKGRCKPEFWMDNTPAQSSSFAVEDEKGVIFYVRAEKLIRLHIQFAPPEEKKRSARAIIEFTKWLKGDAVKHGYMQIVFESVYRPLVLFLHRLGFKTSPNEQVYDLRGLHDSGTQSDGKR
jgi:hypothetical protein